MNSRKNLALIPDGPLGRPPVAVQEGRRLRTEQLAPVWVTPADLVQLPDLSAYGHVVVTAQPLMHRVDDGSAAADETDLRSATVRNASIWESSIR